MKPLALYFVLSDYVDMQYLSQKMSQGNKLQETADEVIDGLTTYGLEFTNAAYVLQIINGKGSERAFVLTGNVYRY